VGDGHLRGQLEKQVVSLGLEGDVLFTGSRNDPEGFYSALDVVALTSLNEGTPLTLIEAMANSRPVIATAVGGVLDLLGSSDLAEGPGEVDHGKTGYMVCERGISVDSNNADAFCKGLQFLLEREDLRREMGERGRVFVEKNYSKERLVADVLALYQELVGHVRAFSTGRSPDTHAA